MAIDFVKVTLTDTKKAWRVDGIPDSPLYLRVRLLDKQQLFSDSGIRDISLKAEAYQVDAAGVPTGTVDAPDITKTINGGALADGQITMSQQVQDLQQECIKAWVRFRKGMQDLDALPTELVD